MGYIFIVFPLLIYSNEYNKGVVKRLNVDLEDELYSAFRMKCMQEGVTVSDWVRGRIESWVSFSEDFGEDKRELVMGKAPTSDEALEKLGMDEPRRQSRRKPKVQPGCLGAIAHETGTCKCWVGFKG